MGINGNIILFPTNGTPAQDTEATAYQIVRAFESLGLVLDGTTDNLEPIKGSSVTFEEYFGTNPLDEGGYTYIRIGPERLTEALGSLVYLLAEDADGNPTPIELPYIEITVMSRPVVVREFVNDEVLGEAWAGIEFSYEDVQLDPAIHQIRDERHPMIAQLEKILSSEIAGGVVCY